MPKLARSLLKWNGRDCDGFHSLHNWVLLVSCDYVLKFDWYCQFSGSGSNSLNLSGHFSYGLGTRLECWLSGCVHTCQESPARHGLNEASQYSCAQHNVLIIPGAERDRRGEMRERRWGGGRDDEKGWTGRGSEGGMKETRERQGR